MSKKPAGKIAPFSLRQSAGLRRSNLLSLSLLALSGVVQPGVAEEATAEKPADKPKEEVVTLDAVTVRGDAVDAAKGDANPYADETAPFKVNRSGEAKRTAPILDQPSTIMVIPKETMKATGATSMKEVMRVQPGVTLGTGEGGNTYGDRFIIRGFEARNDVFVDGLRDPGVLSRETFAVEQIEISKGPSSTFAGRGTTGGAVNSVTKMPKMDSFVVAELGAGTDDYKRATLDANEQLSESLAVRANVLYHDTNVAGRDEVFDERKGAALSLRYDISADVNIVVDYYHLDTDAMPDWGIPYDLPHNRPAKVDLTNFYGQTTRDFWETQADIGTFKIDWQLNDNWRLSSQTRYGETNNSYIAGAPSNPNFTAETVSSSPKNRDQDNIYVGHATNFITEIEQGDMLHTVVLGFELTNEKMANLPYVVPAINTNLTPNNNNIDLYNPDPRAWDGRISRSPDETTTELNSKALYVMDTLEINRWWQAFGGLRYDYYENDKTITRNDYVDTAAEASTKDHFLNWHVGGIFKPVVNGSIYASYATSSNPVGELVDGTAVAYGGLGTETEELDVEQNTNYEIGTKWELFDRRTLLTFAVFQTEKDDARIDHRVPAPTPSNPAATITVWDNSGEAEVLGAELGVSGNITDQWSVAGGLAHLDTEITDATNTDLIGLELANVAEKTLTLLNRYELTSQFAVGMTATYRDDVNGGTWAAIPNTTTGLLTEVPAYWRYDLLAEYQFTEQLGVRLNVLNATDERYFDALYRSATPFVYVAPGRSGFVTATYKF
ncbi:MAG: TonB-dependent receptor [Pseudomonadota bacterium]